MTLGQYVGMLLAADAGVVARAGERVYTEVLPQAPTFPAVVFTEVYGDEDNDLVGPTGVRTRRLQVDSWADTRAEATALALAVRAALDGHDGGACGLVVQDASLLSERWEFDPGVNIADGAYRTSQDYEITTSGVES